MIHELHSQQVGKAQAWNRKHQYNEKNRVFCGVEVGCSERSLNFSSCCQCSLLVPRGNEYSSAFEVVPLLFRNKNLYFLPLSKRDCIHHGDQQAQQKPAKSWAQEGMLPFRINSLSGLLLSTSRGAHQPRRNVPKRNLFRSGRRQQHCTSSLGVCTL